MKFTDVMTQVVLFEHLTITLEHYLSKILKINEVIIFFSHFQATNHCQLALLDLHLILMGLQKINSNHNINVHLHWSKTDVVISLFKIRTHDWSNVTCITNQH